MKNIVVPLSTFILVLATTACGVLPAESGGIPGQVRNLVSGGGACFYNGENFTHVTDVTLTMRFREKRNGFPHTREELYEFPRLEVHRSARLAQDILGTQFHACVVRKAAFGQAAALEPDVNYNDKMRAETPRGQLVQIKHWDIDHWAVVGGEKGLAHWE